MNFHIVAGGSADIPKKTRSEKFPQDMRTSPEEDDFDSYYSIRLRLESPVLNSPPVTPQQGSEDEPVYPRWLVGRWQCTQTLTAFSTPLGVEFLGAAGQPLSEAEASAAQARTQIGAPVSLELRWKLSDDFSGAIEDRAFNAKSRADALAGRTVVREARPCDAQGAVACTVLDLQVQGASQKLLTNGLRVVRSGSRVVASERAL